MLTDIRSSEDVKDLLEKDLSEFKGLWTYIQADATKP